MLLLAIRAVTVASCVQNARSLACGALGLGRSLFEVPLLRGATHNQNFGGQKRSMSQGVTASIFMEVYKPKHDLECKH